jgi:c-di-GMP-binding flagellar brake protein YcgR
MAEIEKIQRADLLALFTELQVKKIPLKMHLTNDDDARTTYITEIRKRKRALHFLINAPGDWQQPGEEARLRFEFTDKENIKYVFVTNSWELAREAIWVKFPEFVHRYQRRKLFRLEAPHGTRLFFKVNDMRYKLLVINVSLGGTLGVLVSLTKQMERELKAVNPKILENVELLFPSKDRKAEGSLVKIKRCQIIRREINALTKKFECAIEFKEISEAEQKNLTDLFYQWQREYLRKRSVMRV